MAGAAGGLSFLGYALTTAPGVAGGDSAELVLGAYTNGIVHAPGYPLYLTAASAFAALPIPLFDYAGRVNLFSAVAAALAVALVAALIAALAPGHPAMSVGVALLYAAAPRIWEQAVVAEVYALHTALTAVALLAFVRGRLAAAVGLLAVAVAHHPAAWLVAVVLAPALLWTAGTPRRRVLVILALVAAPLAAYATLPARAAADPLFNILVYFDRDLTRPADVLWMVRGGMFGDRMLAYGPLGWAAELARFGLGWGRSFLVVGLPTGAVGIWWLWGRSRQICALLVLVFCGQVAFFSSYDVFDKASMYHTAYLAWAVLAGVGAVWLRRRFGRWAVAGLWVLVGVQVVLGAYTFTGAARTATATDTANLLALLPPGALLAGEWRTVRPVEYVQVVGGVRGDVRTYDYTLVSLGLRDRTGLDGAALSEATRRALYRELDCAAPPVYIDNPAVLRGRYEVVTVTDRIHRVIVSGCTTP